MENPTTNEPQGSEPPQPKKKNRRGKASKAKAFDNFREKKNRKVQDQLDKERDEEVKNLRKGFDKLKIEPIFQRTPQKVCQPPIEFPAKYWYLPVLVKKVMEILPQSRVVFADGEYDRMSKALQCISVAQLEAKVFYSRVGSQFRHEGEWRAERYQLCQRIAEVASRNFRPIVTFLDQVGKFQINQQEFIPGCHDNPDDRMCSMPVFSDLVRASHQNLDRSHMFRRVFEFFNEVEFDMEVIPPDSVPVGRVGPNGRPMYVRILDADAAGVAGFLFIDPDDPRREWRVNHQAFSPIFAEYIELGEPRGLLPIDIDEELRWFGLLMAKVQNRVGTRPFADIDIKGGVGTPSQLVGRYLNSVQGEADSWCLRQISDSEFVTGSVFEFGAFAPQEHPHIYLPDIPAIRCGVFVENAIEEMVASCIRD